MLAQALLRAAALEWQTPPEDPRSVAEAATYFGAFPGLPPRIALLADGRFVRLPTPLTFILPDRSK